MILPEKLLRFCAGSVRIRPLLLFFSATDAAG